MRRRNITIVDLTERAKPFISCLDDGFTIVHLPDPVSVSDDTGVGPGKLACIPAEAMQAMHAERRRTARLKAVGRYLLGTAAIAVSFYAGVAVARAEGPIDLTPHGIHSPLTAFITAYDQVPWHVKGTELLKAGAKPRRMCFPNGDRDGNFAETCFAFLEGRARGRAIALRMVVTKGMDDIREWCVIPQDNPRARQCLDQDSGEAFTYQVRNDGVWIDDNDEPTERMYEGE